MLLYAKYIKSFLNLILFEVLQFHNRCTSAYPNHIYTIHIHTYTKSTLVIYSLTLLSNSNIIETKFQSVALKSLRAINTGSYICWFIDNTVRWCTHICTAIRTKDATRALLWNTTTGRCGRSSSSRQSCRGRRSGSGLSRCSSSATSCGGSALEQATRRHTNTRSKQEECMRWVFTEFYII